MVELDKVLYNQRENMDIARRIIIENGMIESEKMGAIEGI